MIKKWKVGIEANCTVTTQFIFVRDTSNLTRYGGHHRVRLPLLDTIVQSPYMGMLVRFINIQIKFQF